MRIELKGFWTEDIEKHLKSQIKKVKPADGWWWDDCRFDYEYGSIRGVAGEIIQDYDSARHKSIESVIIPLAGFPIPSYDEEEPIHNETELMEFIKMVIIDEFPAVDCGEDWPELRLVAGFSIRTEFGDQIHRDPAKFLELKFEFEPAN